MEQALYQETLHDRMMAYTFLARAYRTAPDRALLESLQAIDFNAQTPLARSIEECKASDLEQYRIELAAEYNRTFLNMGPDPVAPYESVYTSPERLLMQEARDEVRAAYRTEGLSLAADAHLPEDHLSFEFDFMGRLCNKGICALEAGAEDEALAALEQQRCFFREHLATWVPAFCDDMEKKVQTSFYQELCTMTRELIEADGTLLLQN